MHDGSLSTLKKVVQFYNEGGSKDPLLSPIMGSLNLSNRDVDDLVEFLRSLSGDQKYTPPSRNEL